MGSSAASSMPEDLLRTDLSDEVQALMVVSLSRVYNKLHSPGSHLLLDAPSYTEVSLELC